MVNLTFSSFLGWMLPSHERSYLYLTAEFDYKNSSSWKRSLVSYCWCLKWQLYFFLSFHYLDSCCQNFITLWRGFTVSRQKGFTSSNGSIDLHSPGIFHGIKHTQHYNFIKNNFLFCYASGFFHWICLLSFYFILFCFVCFEQFKASDVLYDLYLQSCIRASITNHISKIEVSSPFFLCYNSFLIFISHLYHLSFLGSQLLPFCNFCCALLGIQISLKI